MIFRSDLIPRYHWQYGWRDVLRGVYARLSPPTENGSIHLEGVGDCLPIRSGRAALVAAIRAKGLQPGSSIAVSLYCCPVVFEAIVASECVPLFVDVDSSTFCISIPDLAEKADTISAVIAVHMFGNLCDMDGICAVTSHKPVIEDCAQALGSTMKGCAAGAQSKRRAGVVVRGTPESRDLGFVLTATPTREAL